MIEWPLIFVGGLLGSTHCVGMCGGFALSIGAGTPDWRRNLSRQSVYSVGRLFTYATLGAAAGFAGLWLERSLPWLVDLQAWLAIAAGVLLIGQGLFSLGRIPWRRVRGAGACLGGSFFASFLRGPGWANVFLAGLFTGLLPYGLVYAFLALATSTGSLPLGAAVMTLFGLGTAPLMIATGVGGSLVGMAARRRLWQAAAWCVIVVGCISIGRGWGFLNSAQAEPAQRCPMCAPAAEAS